MSCLTSIVGSIFIREVVKPKQLHVLCHIIYCQLGYDGTTSPEFSSVYGSELELAKKRFFLEILVVQVQQHLLLSEGCDAR